MKRSGCRFEGLLFKLEVLDHKARERAGVITPTLGSPIPVLLQLDFAMEVILHFLTNVIMHSASYYNLDLYLAK